MPALAQKNTSTSTKKCTHQPHSHTRKKNALTTKKKHTSAPVYTHLVVVCRVCMSAQHARTQHKENTLTSTALTHQKKIQTSTAPAPAQKQNRHIHTSGMHAPVVKQNTRNVNDHSYVCFIIYSNTVYYTQKHAHAHVRVISGRSDGEGEGEITK